MSWIDEKINEYYQWLKDNTAIREDKGTGWFTVDSPFAGLFNDHIEIFVKKESETEILLSDDGETLCNLSLSGVDISRSSKRKEYLQKILNNYGVRLDGDEIFVTSNGADFAKKKHALVSAIISASDMDMLANTNITSMFSEDVMAFADMKGVLYTPMFIVRGKSGLDFNFDFQVAGRQSELAVKTFNSLKQNNLSSYLFCLGDVKEARERTSGKEFRSLAIVNDAGARPSARLIDALRTYNTNVMLWSDRERPEYADVFKADKLIA